MLHTHTYIYIYQLSGAVRSPLLSGIDVKCGDVDSEEAVHGSSPPLELRRQSAVRGAGTRGGLSSPHDRATDSPQVATVYQRGMASHYTPPSRYYDTGSEPPPAHLPRTVPRHHHPLPGSEAPPAGQPRLQVATPPHASQVPPQADSLLMLLQVTT